MQPGGKYWRSSLCDHAEAASDGDVVGFSKRCDRCNYVRCVETVEQGAVACVVVGASPSHEYESGRA